VRCLALLLLSGCAVAVPTVRPSPSAPLPAVELEVCRLDGEVQRRSQWAAIDALSFEPWHQVIGSVVVKHPRGTLVIDPAFGDEIAADLRQAPLWFRLVMGDAHGKAPLLKLMDAAGLDSRAVRWVALTHVHWDHAGALRDLPLTTVWLSQPEHAFARTLKGHLDHGAIPRQLEIAAVRFAPFAFDEGPRDGFDRSHDLFGDGSVVAFPLPGHTPGSTGYLVHGKGGQRWLFVGDAVWSLQSVKQPVMKNRIASLAVDGDRAQAAETIGLLHALQQSRPDIQIVPSHDLDAMQSVSPCAPKRD
jgi:N-acyl homoserine lactone hydrolase